MKNPKLSTNTTTIVVVVLVLILFILAYRTKVNNASPSALTGSAVLSLVDTLDTVPQVQVAIITKKLKLFNSGSEVGMLQQSLSDAGYNIGRIDKIFGAKTFNAVKQVQLQYGLPANGIVDGKTRNVINNLIIVKANEKYQEQLNIQEEQKKQEEERIKEEQRQEEQRQEEQKKNEDLKKQDDLRIKQEQKQEQKQEEQQKDTIEFISTKTENVLFKDYSCKEENNEKMFVWNGETIDETKNSIYRLSDVWSTSDGKNWKQESKDTKIGERWETMIVKVGDVVYSFGGKYEKTGNSSDNEIYKSTDLINWTYIGDIPEMDHNYDRSVVYFNDKFWLLGSEEGKNGVWSSSTGEKWTQVLTKTPWDGIGMDRLYNTKGRYDSNSLGAYVINNKMWYLVYNNQQNAGYPNYALMRLYSTSDGKNWSDEGYLINKDDSSYFNIASNINPAPVTMDGKVWIVSYSRKTSQPMVINTSNGKDWYLVSTSDTNMTTDSKSYYLAHNYPSVGVFQNKLWTIGGWDVKGNSNSNDNSNDIWASSDGIKWTNMVPKGITFPAIADRWLASITTIGSSSPKSENLEIQKEYNATEFLTGKDETNRTLGKWKMIAGDDKTNTGDVVISNLSFIGTDYKTSSNVQFSSLESLENIIIYAGSTKVGQIKSFKGPFYDSTGKYALPQTITLDKNITLKAGESIWISIVADFPLPKYKNFEMRTWLAGIGFKDEYSTPCNVSTNDNGDGDYKFAGRNLYFKDR